MSVRGVAGGACALALASIVACSEVPVVQSVAESEANHVVATLDRAGIASRKEADETGGTGAPTFHVSVGADEVARAVGVLEARALPHQEAPGFRETFGQPSLVPSASEERARAAQAVAGELARTLDAIDGVLEARVHLSLPDTHELPLDGTAAPRASASVLVRYEGTRAPFDDDAVKRLVAGAVSGLRAEDVTVVTVGRALTPAVTEARLSWVGPIAVARGSASALRVALAMLVAMVILLASTIVVLLVQKRRAADAPADDRA